MKNDGIFSETLCVSVPLCETMSVAYDLDTDGDEMDPVFLPEQYLQQRSTAEETYTLSLQTVGPSADTGKVRVYDSENALVLNNAGGGNIMTATFTRDELEESESLWIEYAEGGIIGVELSTQIPALDNAVVADTVRATGIACDPKPGRILFVNPSGTAGSPCNDYTDACAVTIGNALAVAEGGGWHGDNIVLSCGTYLEYGLEVSGYKDVLIAGMGARFIPGKDALDNDTYVYDFSSAPVIDGSAQGGIFSVSVHSDARVGFSGLVMQNGKAQKGGAVFMDGGELKASYLKFKDNLADDFGGAVCLLKTSSVLIKGCEFKGNEVDYDDGGVKTFDKGMGGAIAALYSTLTVTNCLFDGNSAQVSDGNGGVPKDGSAGGGGDIYLRQGDLTLLKSQLFNARAGFIIVPKNPTKNEVYFTGDGGSLLVHGEKANTKLTIRDCLFEGSQSYGNGGTISLSKDSSPEGRKYFVPKVASYIPPAVESMPDQLGGGCIGLISNVTFISCLGGWQGGAISANGRGMELQILDSEFKQCKGGETHSRDGKGGAIAVGGGLQSSSEPENNVVIKGYKKKCIISGCQASGNGGGVYVTIRGKVTLSNTSIENCTALDSADFPMVEGMGGGAHVSAGGFLYLNGTFGKQVKINGNTANVSGGGLSAKSGRIYIEDVASVVVNGNRAEGSTANGYGNGGGVFVTTSRHDDAFFWEEAIPFLEGGAGNGAAYVFKEDGVFSSSSPNLLIYGNIAYGWGGGLYVGISPPWYYVRSISGNKNNASVVLENGTVSDNTCIKLSTKSPQYTPAQIAAERVAGSKASLVFNGAKVSGRVPLGDIGIYTLDSIPLPVYNPVPTFSFLAVGIIEE